MFGLHRILFKILPTVEIVLDPSTNTNKGGERSFGMETMGDPSDPGGGDITESGDRPEIQDTSGLGGGIWIVLFGCVIVISLAANLILSVLVVRNRKKHNLVYFIHLFLFAINLLESSLLIFEFSLGIEHEYPYTQSACTMYQVVVKGNPIIQASAIVIMLVYASKTYSTQNLPPSCASEFADRIDRDNKSHNYRLNNNNVTDEITEIRNHGSRRCNQRKNDFIIFGCVIIFLVIIEFILSIPTALFSSIVNVKDKRYCEIDLSSYLNKYGGEDGTSEGHYNNSKLHQMILCLYYLIYSSILTFWLPLLVRILFIIINL